MMVLWSVYRTWLEVEYAVPTATLAPRVQRGPIPGPPGAMGLACDFRAISTSLKGAGRAQRTCALLCNQLAGLAGAAFSLVKESATSGSSTSTSVLVLLSVGIAGLWNPLRA